MEIEVRKITKYAKRGKAIRRAVKKQQEEREVILQEMLAGYELPTHGPYVLALSQCGGKEFSWEEEYRLLLLTVLTLLTKVYARKHSEVTARRLALKKVQDMKSAAFDQELLKLTEETMKKVKEAAPNKESLMLYGKEYIGGVKMEGEVNPDYRVQRVA